VQEARSVIIDALNISLCTVIFIICVYAARHYWFTFNRLFGLQRHPYVDIDTANWPRVTVVIPAHNEQAVIGHILEALLQTNYPEGKLVIMPVNDRSTDGTRAIIDDFVRRYPGRLRPIHRDSGKPGKGAALNVATALIDTQIMLIFDADYIPGRGLIRQLVAPFFDPEVGAVMGRVVPQNAGANGLTRLLDLERAGGYQVDQQARMNLDLVPLYGGTVGGLRLSALRSLGGWNPDSLTEDTDATFRLVLGQWKVVYQNRSECYEEVPEKWHTRVRQIMRWAKGHNQSLFNYVIPIIRAKHIPFSRRVDAVLLLGVFLIGPLLLVGWVLSLIFFYAVPGVSQGLVILLAFTAYTGLGNLAVFFQIACAGYLDRSQKRVLLLPFGLLSFVVNLVSISIATLQQIMSPIFRGGYVWHKTERFRT
jgi:cellulose synthase/poly-beta-1,6-N-acetylglucosamine synthase-like glycosyltransferase